MLLRVMVLLEQLLTQIKIIVLGEWRSP